MTNEAQRLMAEALRVAKLDGSFSPAEMGAKIGLNKAHAEAAARELSNAGVLVLGFDCSANFSPDYRKARSKAEGKASGKQRSGKQPLGKHPSGKHLSGKNGAEKSGSGAAANFGRKRRALAEPSLHG